MKQQLNIDNPFFTFMGRLADVVIVNLLFLACSLPVVTMGASIAAMYETFREMRGEHFSSAARTFFGAFRRSLKKSLIPWSLQLLSGALLIFDLYFVVHAEDAALWHIAAAILGCMFLLWLMIGSYLLPAGVYRICGFKAALARSLFLAVRNAPYTGLMILLNLIPGICILLGNYFIGIITPIYLTAGFGITGFWGTLLLERCRGIETGESYET